MADYRESAERGGADGKPVPPPAALVVLPCIDSTVLSTYFEALRRVAEVNVLPPALPSTLSFRVHSESPDAIVICTGEFFRSFRRNIGSLQEIFSAIPTILLVAELRATIVKNASRFKIHSVLPMEVTTHQLVAAIAAAAAGFAVSLPQSFAETGDRVQDLGFEPLESGERPQTEHLTAREVEVLRLMALGHGNKQIASRLEVSEHTAKFHVSSVLAKLGAQSRTEAVTVGITRGLIAI